MNKESLFNTPVSICSYSQFIKTSVAHKSGYTCFLNVHMVYEHHNNPEFKTVLNEAEFVVTDGMPIVYSLNLFKGIVQERIAGNDVMFTLIEKAKKENLKVFLIGSTEEVLGKISAVLGSKEIEHTTYSPPFLPINQFDFDQQAEIINEYAPEIILVGLGCPKQEMWMNRMRHKVASPMFGVGGAFFLFAGIDKRAPEWMRKLSLEWFYRLLLEPKRLFRRYLTTNSYFLWLMLKYAVKKRE